MPVGDVIRVAFEGRAGYGDQIVTTFHWRVTATTQPTFQDEMTELLALVQSEVVPSFLATFNASAIIDRLVARSVEGPPIGTELLLGNTGSRSGDPLPQQLSAEILYRTALLGRRYSGKQKLWPPTETDIAAATWTAAYVSALGTYANNVTTILDNGSEFFAPTVFSKKFGFDNLITNFRVVNDPRTQRTRTIGFGG
jgi:hypothetical protein